MDFGSSAIIVLTKKSGKVENLYKFAFLFLENNYFQESLF